jgi:hypothetical protein
MASEEATYPRHADTGVLPVALGPGEGGWSRCPWMAHHVMTARGEGVLRSRQIHDIGNQTRGEVLQALSAWSRWHLL